MSEMVERVARAICYVREGPCDPETVARKVIETMRHSTDDQRIAYYELSHRTETMFDAHWERAIDAALK